jgi:Uma2 family endonuclease
MGLPAEKLSLAEFLAWENAQPTRNEFYRGEVFAMVGARRVHGTIVANLLAALKQHLKGTRCRPFVESMKVQPADDAIFYPDIFVTCDEADLITDMIFRRPLLVVEVLSESTKGFDRGLKFAAYRRIDVLREYVLVDPDRRSVEVFRRNERGNFELIDQTGAAMVELESVQLRLPMAEVFDGVEPATGA